MRCKFIEQFSIKDIKRISFWGVLIGNIITVYGVIVAYQGFVTSIIGVLPGILAICIGRLIHHSGTQAKTLVESKGKNVSAVDMIMKKISLSFLLIGILMGIFIISYGLFILIV